MARRTKLEWMKDLREANLSNAEFRLLVILATYSDKSLLNAHPGSQRLVRDTGMARSTVLASLKSLQEKGWIRLTEAGGHQYGWGLANTFSIHTPPTIHKGPIDGTVIHKGTDHRPLKGSTRETLDDPEGSDSRTKGPMSGRKGSDSPPEKGLVDRTPSGHTSGPGSDPFHHSAAGASGARASATPQQPDPWQYDRDGGLTEDSYDRLLDELGALHDTEASTVDGMLANGAHPKAVINTINKQRSA